MAFCRRLFTPFYTTLRSALGVKQALYFNRSISSACNYRSFYGHSTPIIYWNQLQKRQYSELPHDFFPRILKDYKPEDNDLSKEKLLSELKTTKDSFERVIGIFLFQTVE